MKITLKTLSFLFILFIMSCTDPCKDVNCMNEGVCDDGTCLCADGYEGTNCENEIRAKYYGIFSGTVTCDDGSTQELKVEFKEGSDLDKILVFDPEDNSSIGQGTLNGTSLEVPPIEFEIFGITVTNEFTITFKSVDEVDFTIDSKTGPDTQVCSGILNRQ